MRKALVGITLALSTIIPTATAEPATAHPQRFHVHTTTNDNRDAFKKHRADYFAIKIKAHQKSGKGIRGKAALYLDGKLQRVRYLRQGNILFRVDRSNLRNNRSVTITVRIFPHDDRKQHKIVRRHVTDRPEKKHTSSGHKVVKAAKAQVGKPYRFGAAGPNAYDCSGLVTHAYRKATGQRLPHYSGALRTAGKRVATPKPGDIVWTPGHVSIYIGKGKVVEAARPGTTVRVVRQWQQGATYIRP